MDRDEYWNLFRGTGDIFAYLKYKNEDLMLPNNSNNSERHEGGIRYGAISKFDGYDSGGSTNW